MACIDCEGGKSGKIKINNLHILWTFVGIVMMWYALWAFIDKIDATISDTNVQLAFDFGLLFLGIMFIAFAHPCKLKVII
jgi:hypothetical protein